MTFQPVSTPETSVHRHRSARWMPVINQESLQWLPSQHSQTLLGTTHNRPNRPDKVWFNWHVVPLVVHPCYPDHFDPIPAISRLCRCDVRIELAMHAKLDMNPNVVLEENPQATCPGSWYRLSPVAPLLQMLLLLCSMSLLGMLALAVIIRKEVWWEGRRVVRKCGRLSVSEEAEKPKLSDQRI